MRHMQAPAVCGESSTRKGSMSPSSTFGLRFSYSATLPSPWRRKAPPVVLQTGHNPLMLIGRLLLSFAAIHWKLLVNV